METKLPAIQAEQVEDDVAPMTAEYVPAKASDEEWVKSIRRQALMQTHERKEDGGGKQNRRREIGLGVRGSG